MARLPKILESLPDPDDRVEDGTEPAAAGALARLQAALDYRFERPALLRTALTLGSWANEHPEAGWPSNACLEFFGDAVLGLVAADALWLRFPELAEGELTRLRASLVSELTLASVARGVDLGAYLHLGRGDVKRGGRTHASTLADAMEAVIGAVFLDARAAGRAPLATASALFERMYEAELDAIGPEHGLDPKSRLQHWAQARYRITPVYIRVGEPPPPGAPKWRARVELQFASGRTDVLGEGEGRSLKRAERQAAERALVHVGVDAAPLE
jgi:ribonuclease-3